MEYLVGHAAEVSDRISRGTRQEKPTLPRTKESCEGDVWKDCELSCEGARGVLGCLLGEAGDCGGGEWQRVEVGAMGIGVFAVGGDLLAGEIEESIPEAARAEKMFT